MTLETSRTLPRQVHANAAVPAADAAAFWSLVPRLPSARAGSSGIHPVHACSVVGCQISIALREHFGSAPVVHLGQRVRPWGSIDVDEDMAIDARIAGVTPKTAGVVLEIVARVACRGQRVLESGVLLLAAAVDGTAPDRTNALARWSASQVAGAEPVSTWEERVRYTLTEADIARFALCTGDDQAIHLSNDVARAAGLPGVIAHGMHTVAACYQAAADEADRVGQQLREFGIRFARPVVPHRPVAVEIGHVAGGIAVRAVSRGRALTRGGLASVGEPSSSDRSG